MLKKFFAALLVLAVLLALGGCAEEGPVTVEKNGMTFTVDTENRTVSYGGDTYTYSQTARGSSLDITIYYPNGATYSDTTSTQGAVTSGYSSWSDDYDPGRYLPGSTLVSVVTTASKTSATYSVDWGRLLLGVICVAGGILDVVFPCFWWQLRYGLFVQDAEPTEFAISMSRIGGVICAVIGIFVFISGFVG